jgi:hypothetical protein
MWGSLLVFTALLLPSRLHADTLLWSLDHWLPEMMFPLVSVDQSIDGKILFSNNNSARWINSCGGGIRSLANRGVYRFS